MNHFACARCPFEAASLFWHCECGEHPAVLAASCACGRVSPMETRRQAREASLRRPRRRQRYSSTFGWTLGRDAT